MAKTLAEWAAERMIPPANRSGRMPKQQPPSPRVVQQRPVSPGRMPTAAELLEQTKPLSDDEMPGAARLMDMTGGWEPLFPDDDGTSYYSPTASINPPRPRTREMSYNRANRRLRVVYRDGGTYEYFDFPPDLWAQIKRVKSPGRFLDRRVIGAFNYEKVGA